MGRRRVMGESEAWNWVLRAQLWLGVYMPQESLRPLLYGFRFALAPYVREERPPDVDVMVRGFTSPRGVPRWRTRRPMRRVR